MTKHPLRGPTSIIRRAVGNPDLHARLAEQDAIAAELRLALDSAVLALDRRLLDLYALTEAARAEADERLRDLAALTERARAEARERSDAIERALASPESPLAMLVSAEAARVDSYLVHHIAKLRHDLGVEAGATSPSPPDLDLVLPYGGYDVAVPGGERGLVASLLQGRSEILEPGVRAVLRRELRTGALAVDAGATIGLHALTMADRVGPAGRVVCFEPAPHLAVSLRRTLALNGFASRAEVRPIALAGAEGHTLDAQIPAGTRVDLVRLNVDGAEPSAWRGAERVVRENPAILFVLAWSASSLTGAGHAPAAVLAEIRAAGFSPFVIASGDPDGALSPLAGDPVPHDGCNLLLRRG